jgi:hypothetical protein
MFWLVFGEIKCRGSSPGGRSACSRHAEAQEHTHLFLLSIMHFIFNPFAQLFPRFGVSLRWGLARRVFHQRDLHFDLSKEQILIEIDRSGRFLMRHRESKRLIAENFSTVTTGSRSPCGYDEQKQHMFQAVQATVDFWPSDRVRISNACCTMSSQHFARSVGLEIYPPSQNFEMEHGMWRVVCCSIYFASNLWFYDAATACMKIFVSEMQHLRLINMGILEPIPIILPIFYIRHYKTHSYYRL